MKVIECKAGWAGKVESKKVLAGALAKDMNDVLVIGYTVEEDLFLASSTADVGTLLLLLERGRRHLMNLLDNEQES